MSTLRGLEIQDFCHLFRVGFRKSFCSNGLRSQFVRTISFRSSPRGRASKRCPTQTLHLKGLTDLKALLLGNTQVTDAGVQDFRKALPNCEIIR